MPDAFDTLNNHYNILKPLCYKAFIARLDYITMHKFQIAANNCNQLKLRKADIL